MTKKELLAKIAALGLPEGDSKIPGIVCQLIGHSKIQTYCFGYYGCARCGQTLGDALGSVYLDAQRVVIVGHDCDICRSNYKQLTWQDKFMAPDPFAKEEVGQI